MASLYARKLKAFIKLTLNNALQKSWSITAPGLLSLTVCFRCDECNIVSGLPIHVKVILSVIGRGYDVYSSSSNNWLRDLLWVGGNAIGWLPVRTKNERLAEYVRSLARAIGIVRWVHIAARELLLILRFSPTVNVITVSSISVNCNKVMSDNRRQRFHTVNGWR